MTNALFVYTLLALPTVVCSCVTWPSLELEEVISSSLSLSNLYSAATWLCIFLNLVFREGP